MNTQTIAQPVISGKIMSITRILDVPPETVFKIFTDPKHITHWWGPRGYSTTTKSQELKSGGAWLFTMHSPDGINYQNKVVYTEVNPPKKLVYHHVDDDDANATVSFHVTVTFEEQGGKTKLTMQSTFESAEELQRVVREYGATEGLRDTIQRLSEYLEKTSTK